MPETETEGEEEAEIYELAVELRQTAMVAVEATSHEEAWDAVKMPNDRETQEVLRKKQFKGAEYQPEDIIAVGDVEEADLSVVGGEE